MNKAITSFWKRLFFRYDVSRMRKTVVDYLTAEGIQAEVKDGMIQVLFEDYYYNVEFDLDGEYPRCDISFRMKDEMYESWICRARPLLRIKSIQTRNVCRH